MTPSDQNAAELAEARARLRLITEHLPTAVDPLAVSKIAKAPFFALCVRESQTWRVEEFGRAACDMLERGDVVVGISNVRHAVESCAAVWYLKRLIERQLADGLTPDHYETIVRLHLGSKTPIEGAPEIPEAINVLTMLKQADKELPGILRSYERLSEVAHPNYLGSAAVFGKPDHSTLIWHFGKHLRDHSDNVFLGLHALNTALGIFLHAYERVGDLTPRFATACEEAIAAGKKLD
jgi:hypothetical protein